jgi:hypothetical protein
MIKFKKIKEKIKEKYKSTKEKINEKIQDSERPLLKRIHNRSKVWAEKILLKKAHKKQEKVSEKIKKLEKDLSKYDGESIEKMKKIMEPEELAEFEEKIKEEKESLEEEKTKLEEKNERLKEKSENYEKKRKENINTINNNIDQKIESNREAKEDLEKSKTKIIAEKENLKGQLEKLNSFDIDSLPESARKKYKEKKKELEEQIQEYQKSEDKTKKKIKKLKEKEGKLENSKIQNTKKKKAKKKKPEATKKKTEIKKNKKYNTIIDNWNSKNPKNEISKPETIINSEKAFKKYVNHFIPGQEDAFEKFMINQQLENLNKKLKTFIEQLIKNNGIEDKDIEARIQEKEDNDGFDAGLTPEKKKLIAQKELIKENDDIENDKKDQIDNLEKEIEKTKQKLSK